MTNNAYQVVVNLVEGRLMVEIYCIIRLYIMVYNTV